MSLCRLQPFFSSLLWEAQKLRLLPIVIALTCSSICCFAQSQTTSAFAEYVEIVNVNSGKVLDVPGSSTNNGTSLWQWDWVAGRNQVWQFVPVGAHYKIVNVNSGKVLDVDASSVSNNGATVWQWGWVAGTNQMWDVVSVGAHYKIVNVNSGKVLDVNAASITNNGATVWQWDWVSGANQMWDLVPVLIPPSGVTPGIPLPQSSPTPPPTLTSPAAVSGSVTNCNDISGNWFDPYSNIFRLSQNGSTVSGDTVQPDQTCGAVVWQITGYATGPNTFSLTEFNPNPSVDSCGRVVEQQETANVAISACSQAKKFLLVVLVQLHVLRAWEQVLAAT